MLFEMSVDFGTNKLSEYLGELLGQRNLGAILLIEPLGCCRPNSHSRNANLFTFSVEFCMYRWSSAAFKRDTSGGRNALLRGSLRAS